MSITVNGTTGLNFPDGTSQPTAGFAPFRNRIINGNMRIDQRNLGTSVNIASPATIYYAADRFQTRLDTGTSNTVQQSTVAPPGFKTSYLVTIGGGASIASSSFGYFGQRIEGYNIADFDWGTSAAASATLSFWVRSSLTGTFGVSLRNADANRSYVSSYTISSANTWEYKTLTIPGETTGSWNITNGIGAFLFWDIGQGSTASTSTTNVWQSANFSGLTGAVKLCNTSGATLRITGVQLEKGSAATAFEHRPYATELAMCQRYFYVAGAIVGGYTISVGSGLSAGSSNVWRCSVALPVPMRSTPSVTETNMDVWNSATGSTAINTISTIYYLNDQIYFELDLTTTTAHGVTGGFPMLMQTKGSGGKSTIEMSAEL